VYGDDTLSDDRVQDLLDPDPSAQTRTDEEVRETIDDLFDLRPNLNDTLRAAVDTRRQEIIAERRSMQSELAESEGHQTTAWTEGIADIAEGSFDVLAMTVYYPA
jgi:small-conductance mechanosensitive channel